MKTKYKHIHFLRRGGLYASKRCYSCVNTKSGDSLGQVFYYPRWRLYVFAAMATAVFDKNCLRDIAHFLEQLDGG